MGPGQWADLGMYQQSLMLLLKEHGLDSCPQACWTRYHHSVEAFLQMPAEHMLHCAIAVGYADPEAPVNRLASERLPLEAFCTFFGMSSVMRMRNGATAQLNRIYP